jgi:hypothetical protein
MRNSPEAWFLVLFLAAVIGGCSYIVYDLDQSAGRLHQMQEELEERSAK